MITLEQMKRLEAVGMKRGESCNRGCSYLVDEKEILEFLKPQKPEIFVGCDGNYSIGIWIGKPLFGVWECISGVSNLTEALVQAVEKVNGMGKGGG